MLTCSYNAQEFVRVGYYVNNEYTDPALVENPPSQVAIERVQRSILADQPRVTRFPIDFDGFMAGGEEEALVGPAAEDDAPMEGEEAAPAGGLEQASMGMAA